MVEILLSLHLKDFETCLYSPLSHSLYLSYCSRLHIDDLLFCHYSIITIALFGLRADCYLDCFSNFYFDLYCSGFLHLTSPWFQTCKVPLDLLFHLAIPYHCRTSWPWILDRHRKSKLLRQSRRPRIQAWLSRRSPHKNFQRSERTCPSEWGNREMQIHG